MRKLEKWKNIVGDNHVFVFHAKLGIYYGLHKHKLPVTVNSIGNLQKLASINIVYEYVLYLPVVLLSLLFHELLILLNSFYFFRILFVHAH